jgi:phosphoribosyl 1,2-cyclic phosphodiesterase
MSLSICILASGSSGNSIYVASERTRILIDAGVSAKQVSMKLEQIGVAPESINGICVSHEHGDHVAGIRVLQKRHGIPVYANAGTLKGIMRQAKSHEISAKVFQTGVPFKIGDITIDPFSVPHDAFEPVGFRIQCGEESIGIATDLGMATSLVREKLRGCATIVVESNYDVEMLKESPRPWTLKTRIKNRQGHLSNDQVARLIADVAADTLERVFLAHLSSDCNTPEVALHTVSNYLRGKGLGRVSVEVGGYKGLIGLAEKT